MSGTIHVVDSSPETLRTRAIGRFDDAMCAELIRIVANWAGGRTGLTAFHDASGVDDYDVAARERVSEWSREHAAQFEAVHVLVGGRGIAWGLKIVGMVSRARFIPYHSLAAFEAAYDAHSRSRQALRRA